MAVNSEDSFLALLESHDAAVRRIARVYAGDRGQEEDLYQEILMQAWKSLPSFRGDSSPGTWLYRVALNTALTWKRGEIRRRDRRSLMEARAASPRPSPAPAPSLRSEAEILHDFLDSLSGPNRAVLVLYMEGLGHAEIAQVTGLTLGAVGVRVHRMKASFVERYLEGPER